MSDSKGKPKSYWKDVDFEKYQNYVTIPSVDSIADETTVYMDDLERREEAYGICGECNEPGTGYRWCKSCNANRLQKNFKNWTSGNKAIDEFIQHSQLNAVYYDKLLEWIPFEDIQNVTYVTKGGFGKIYSARWIGGFIYKWDIEEQEWERNGDLTVALKSLDNSSDISTDFLNEIKSHLQIYVVNVVRCYGITQDPDTKNYMMVLKYCNNGNLRDFLSKRRLSYEAKISKLHQIAKGLSDVHNAGKVHKDFHSGNILFIGSPYISDLGMCQPANNQEKSKGIFGVLPYMAPEVLRGRTYTKSSDIYSFGIIMNEFMSEEIPYGDMAHDHTLGIEICKGCRPPISDDTPKLIADLIMKCWDAKEEERPTTKVLRDTLEKWHYEVPENGENTNRNSVIYAQIKECEKIRESKSKNTSSNDKNVPTHPQAVYTSRLMNFKNLPKPVNSSNLSSSLVSTSEDIINTKSSENLTSECLDVQLSELDLVEETNDGSEDEDK